MAHCSARQICRPTPLSRRRPPTPLRHRQRYVDTADQAAATCATRSSGRGCPSRKSDSAARSTTACILPCSGTHAAHLGWKEELKRDVRVHHCSSSRCADAGRGASAGVRHWSHGTLRQTVTSAPAPTAPAVLAKSGRVGGGPWRRCGATDARAASELP